MINRRRILDNKFIPKPYLKFTALEDGTFKHNTDDLEYSLNDGKTWTALPANTDTPTIHAGESICWRGTMNPSIKDQWFVSTGKFDVSGNPLSLKYKNKFIGAPCVDYQFYKLFCGCTNLINAKDLIIPDDFNNRTTVCGRMFEDCTSLISAPKLPALILSIYCYFCMFRNCKSLVVPPELPAITLADSCYSSMFIGCINMTTIPDLFATSIPVSSYNNMFTDCNSLKDIILYEGMTTIGTAMFYGCRGLESLYIPSTITSISSTAFYKCPKLKRIDISNLNNYLNIILDNNTSCPTFNGSDLYLNGEKITEVTLSKADANRFCGCTSLQKVNWDGNITSIGSNIFNGCTGLTEITIPSTVTTIGT